MEEQASESWDTMMGSLAGQGQEWGQGSGPHGRKAPCSSSGLAGGSLEAPGHPSSSLWQMS